MIKIISILVELASILCLIVVGNAVAFGYYEVSFVSLVLAGLFAGLGDELVM